MYNTKKRHITLDFSNINIHSIKKQWKVFYKWSAPTDQPSEKQLWTLTFPWTTSHCLYNHTCSIFLVKLSTSPLLNDCGTSWFCSAGLSWVMLWFLFLSLFCYLFPWFSVFVPQGLDIGLCCLISLPAFLFNSLLDFGPALDPCLYLLVLPDPHTPGLCKCVISLLKTQKLFPVWCFAIQTW